MRGEENRNLDIFNRIWYNDGTGYAKKHLENIKMKYIAIDNEFFKGTSSEVAKGLIGATMHLKTNGMKKYFVLETEAYDHDEVDKDGKYICYGGGKGKHTVKRLVSAPLFDLPGTWCVYGGQLLLSVTDDEHANNVLIKSIQDEDGRKYGPDAMAKELHLYKSKPDYIKCHGEFSLNNGSLCLIDRESEPQYIASKRVNIRNDKKLNFKKIDELQHKI